ncbi:putative helicase [Rhizobium phage vB_RglS_P106B]|uniref:Putative helicase n=1 Tax=Rhizobium phage vB_RglS_P106B TaxID=1458697 RepID=W6EKI1_9CAUD|nr:DNA helicase [Rhizobium phage vB_RglS_P106B]AHJ10741.1 putative helicase [Rhizobium phage vB_RglS_P106B]
MQQIILRPDQQQLKYDIYSGWQRGMRNMLASLATGGGKSIIVSDIVLDGDRAGMRQPVIAHRNELVSQMSHHVARRGIYHRIIGDEKIVKQIRASHREEFGQSFIHPTANCSVVGIDTLLARADDLIEWGKQQDRWTIDEAHHVLKANKWGRGVLMFPNAYGLGVTATAGRPDGQGLGAFQPDGSIGDGVFHDIAFGPEMRWLINNGALTDYEIVCPQSDLQIGDDAITDGGDFSPKKLKAAAEKSRIVGDVLREYARYAFGKRAICFATDVETSNKIAKQFNDAGIPAASVSAKTPTHVRDKYIREFKSGKIWILVNVDLFDEGFDVPACEVVIMARPTASIVKYLQMFGRALRVMAGKLYGLIIDHVSNVMRHGLPDKPREWSLSRREKRGKQEKDPEDIPMTRCLNIGPPACCKPYERVLSCCPHCGWKPPLPEPGTGGRSIEQVDGNLVLLDRAALEAKRKAMQIESAEAVAQRVAKAAGGAAAEFTKNKQIAKIQAWQRCKMAIEQWAGIERSKGRDDEQSYKRFYLTTGVDVLEALNGDRTREQFEEMAARVEGWYR